MVVNDSRAIALFFTRPPVISGAFALLLVPVDETFIEFGNAKRSAPAINYFNVIVKLFFILIIDKV